MLWDLRDTFVGLAIRLCLRLQRPRIILIFFNLNGAKEFTGDFVKWTGSIQWRPPDWRIVGLPTGCAFFFYPWGLLCVFEELALRSILVDLPPVRSTVLWNQIFFGVRPAYSLELCFEIVVSLENIGFDHLVILLRLTAKDGLGLSRL